MTQHDEQLQDRASAGRAPRQSVLPKALDRPRGDGATLDPGGERELWDGHTSWKHFADLVLVAVGWTIIAAIVWFTTPPSMGWTVLILTLGGWLYVAARIGHGILYHHYRLTTQRLFIERGILSRTIDQAELIRVDDVRIHKTLLNRLTRLGSLEIFSTDASDRRVMIVGIENPESLADSIREHMRTLRERSLFVESL